MSRWFRVAEEEKKKYQYNFYIRQNLENGYPYTGMNQDESNEAFEKYVTDKAKEIQSKVPSVESYSLKFNDIWYNAGAVLHVVTNDIIQPVYIERIFEEGIRNGSNNFIDWIEIIPGDYNV